MAGCYPTGNLWLHTYLNLNSTRVQDGETNSCGGSSCSVVNSEYRMGRGIYYNYAHGRVSGYDQYEWQLWDNCGC